MGDSRNETRSYKKHKREFFELCRRERRACWLCGQAIDYEAEPGTTPDSLTLDHIKPVSRFPELMDDPTNFAAAHFSCNTRRHDADPPAPLGTMTRVWAAGPSPQFKKTEK